MWPIYQDKSENVLCDSICLKCVKTTRHISACLSGIKTDPRHFTCEHCKKTLEGWYRGKKRVMKFAIPRIWREPTNYSSSCYFCMVDPSKRRTGKNASAIMNLDLPSSIAPVSHCAELPVPTPPERKYPSSEESNKSEEEVDVKIQIILSEVQIRDLGLTKSNVDITFGG
ncbi:uncharacterized protein LOC143255379 [Tachypleus tridentatus]|uniref:uncharacterized protein LOC143255379 n=1 Tax=Tachypleus tridentatus TaxID=6853 RepID=UPI003FD2D7F8